VRKNLLNIIIIITILMAVAVNVHIRKGPGEAAPGQPILREGNSFNTKDIAPDVKGLGGPIEMLVGLDKEGNIEDVEVLSHNETSQYAAGISEPEFLDQFKGKGSEDDFIVGEDIDGVTHATISSSAVAMTLKTSLERINRPGPVSKKKAPFNLNLDFYLTVLIITFLLMAFYLKANWLRYTGLFISVLYFGFWKANFISMTSLGGVFLWNLPDFRSNIAWYVFIFSGLILTFLLGAFYCTYMCPFGGLQIFLNKIFKFNVEITPQVEKSLRKIKYILLWILTVLVLTLNNANIVNYEPFATVFLRRGSVAAWLILAIVLILSLFHHRPFCSWFCAAGAFLDMLSKAGRRVFKKR